MKEHSVDVCGLIKANQRNIKKYYQTFCAQATLGIRGVAIRGFDYPQPI